MSKCKKESCCWISFHVFEPKSTNFYGRKWIERERGREREPILMQVTRRPQALRTTPMLLAVTPLPSPLTTPPVTTTYFIVSFRFLSGKRAERLTLTAPAASAFMGQRRSHSTESLSSPFLTNLLFNEKLYCVIVYIYIRCHLLYLGRGLSG